MPLRRIALPESLSPASIDALSRALDEADADPGPRALVVHGSEKVFCRGMDLSAMIGEGVDPEASLRGFASCMARLRSAKRPTIAVVSGEALGGGVGLAAACDVVLATPDATFALPEALFGLLPGVIMPVLVERMGAHEARLFAMRGSSHDVLWAAKRGLVDEVVGAPDMTRATTRIAREAGRTAPGSVLGLRKWIAELGQLGPEAALYRGAEVTAALVRDPAVQQAVRRFLEDGTPPWVGR